MQQTQARVRTTAVMRHCPAATSKAWHPPPPDRHPSPALPFWSDDPLSSALVGSLGASTDKIYQQDLSSTFEPWEVRQLFVSLASNPPPLLLARAHSPRTVAAPAAHRRFRGGESEQARKTGILSHYTTNERLSILSSFLSPSAPTPESGGGAEAVSVPLPNHSRLPAPFPQRGCNLLAANFSTPITAPVSLPRGEAAWTSSTTTARAPSRRCKTCRSRTISTASNSSKMS